MAKMTGTVFTTDPDGAEVRLLAGTDAPKWYKGPATDAKSSDDEPKALEDHTKDELRTMVEEGELVVAKSASKDELIAALIAADVPPQG
jgi:hypothetical protein